MATDALELRVSDALKRAPFVIFSKEAYFSDDVDVFTDFSTTVSFPELPDLGLPVPWQLAAFEQLPNAMAILDGDLVVQNHLARALGTEVLTFIIDLCRSCEARSPPHGTPSRSPRYWNLQQAVPGHGPMRIWWWQPTDEPWRCLALKPLEPDVLERARFARHAESR
eukprot:g14122.t1